MADLDLSDSGKHVRTRDGKAVRIYATDGKKPWSIHGARSVGGGEWIAHCWDESGMVFYGEDSSADDRNAKNDLIPYAPTETWLIDVPAGQTPVCYSLSERCPVIGDLVRSCDDGSVFQVNHNWSKSATILVPVTPASHHETNQRR